MGGERNGSIEWAGLRSVSVGELVELAEAMVAMQFGFKSRLGDVVE